MTDSVTDRAQQNTSDDQIIFSHIFPILFTKFRHAAQVFLIPLTFLHPLESSPWTHHLKEDRKADTHQLSQPLPGKENFSRIFFYYYKSINSSIAR